MNYEKYVEIILKTKIIIIPLKRIPIKEEMKNNIKLYFKIPRPILTYLAGKKGIARIISIQKKFALTSGPFFGIAFFRLKKINKGIPPYFPIKYDVKLPTEKANAIII